MGKTKTVARVSRLLAALTGRSTKHNGTGGGRSDLEQDAAESGIGDQDGLDEQIPFPDWSMVGMV